MTTYTDDTEIDGDYIYAVATIRQDNQEESVSGLSNTVSVTSDSVVLDAQKEMLSQKIDKEKILISLSSLSRQIIDLVKEHGELSISEIESITKANRNTIKKKLSELVKDKYLLIQGQHRGTRYVIGIK